MWQHNENIKLTPVIQTLICSFSALKGSTSLRYRRPDAIFSDGKRRFWDHRIIELVHVSWIVYAGGRYFDYMFYIDFEASMAEPRAQYALEHLQVSMYFMICSENKQTIIVLVTCKIFPTKRDTQKKKITKERSYLFLCFGRNLQDFFVCLVATRWIPFYRIPSEKSALLGMANPSKTEVQNSMLYIYLILQKPTLEEVLLGLEPSFWSGGRFLLQDHSIYFFFSEFFPSPLGGVVGRHNFRHHTKVQPYIGFICAGILGDNLPWL